MPDTALTALADLRCNHPLCIPRGVYRMVGSCSNCNVKNVLMLFTAEHEAIGGYRCPTCGTRNLRTQRLATEDEIPAAVGRAGDER